MISEQVARIMTIRFMMAQRGISMREIGEHLGQNHRSLTRCLRLTGLKDDLDVSKQDSNSVTLERAHAMMDRIESAITALSSDVYEMSGLGNHDRAVDWWSELLASKREDDMHQLMEES